MTQDPLDRLPTYDFYHIITLESGSRLSISEDQRQLVPWITTGTVFLRPANSEEDWDMAEELCIRGYGFVDENSARDAHDLAKSLLQRELASLGIGCDFTERLQSGACSKAFADQIYEATGRVIRAKYGLIIHPSGEEILFFNASAEAAITKSNSSFIGKLGSESSHEPLTELEMAAVDLLNNAAFLTQPEARLRQLMSTLELFIETDSQGEAIRLVPEVSKLGRKLGVDREVDTNNPPKKSQNSKIGPKAKRIRRFLQNFGKRRYGDLSILAFYELCRKARNDLTHPEVLKIPPTTAHVNWLADNLKRLIGDLVAGEKIVEKLVKQSKSNLPK